MASQAIKGLSILGMAGVGLLVMSLAGTPSAQAQNGGIRADKLEYNTPRTHYYTVGHADFNPRVSGSQFISTPDGSYFTKSGLNNFDAGLHLPDGALIREIRA